MCSAIFLRITDIGSTRSDAMRITGCGAGVDGAGRAEAAVTGAAARAPPDSMNARMSFFVTRPPMPEPAIRDTSTLWSFAMRRTSGDERWRSPEGAGALPAGGRGTVADPPARVPEPAPDGAAAAPSA